MATAVPFDHSLISMYANMLDAKNAERWLWRAMTIISLAIIAYTACRASIVPLSVDEAYTVHGCILLKPTQVILLETRSNLPVSWANNHPLNTWLAYLSVFAFGLSEFSVRLPNLVAQAFYLLAVALYVRKQPSFRSRILSFLFLCINPLLVDYQSVSRGYGLGVACVMWSLLLAAESISSRTSFRCLALAFASLAASSMAVYANYAFVFFTIANAVWITASLIFRPLKFKELEFTLDWRQKAALFAFITWNSTQTFLFAGREVLRLNHAGSFYIGGKSGFWQDAIRSLIEGSAMGITSISMVLEVGFMAILCISVIAAITAFCSRRTKLDDLAASSALWLLLITSAIAIIVGMKEGRYIEGRSALQLLPLMLASVVYFFCDVLPRAIHHSSKVLAFGFPLAMTVLIVNFARVASVDQHSLCSDRNIHKMLDDLHELYKADPKPAPLKLGVSWELAVIVNYYKVANGCDWLDFVAPQRDIYGDLDYVYYLPRSHEEVVRSGAKILHIYPHTNFRLAKISSPIPKPPTPTDADFTGK